jgi:uncharacterized protein (TIGR00645 family)
VASKFQRILAGVLYGSRWILAPAYVGLVVALLSILVEFFRELVHGIAGFADMTSAAVILAVLKLIDLLLVGNLVLIMIFAGVETLVARAADDERPQWMGKVDFSGLKLKVVASIVAIASVQLLETFMDPASVAPQTILWQVVILLAFVVAGLLLAWMDRLSAEPH